MKKQAIAESNSYYHDYIKQVPDKNIIDVLEQQNQQFCEFMTKIDEDKAGFRYAKGKWTIREIIGHLVETEKVFSYRALCISRGDKTKLPGFDENTYIKNSNYDKLKLTDLVELFYLTRKSSIALFKTFTPKMWAAKGNTNNSNVSVRALAYIIAGHLMHHVQVINKLYLN